MLSSRVNASCGSAGFRAVPAVVGRLPAMLTVLTGRPDGEPGRRSGIAFANPGVVGASPVIGTTWSLSNPRGVDRSLMGGVGIGVPSGFLFLYPTLRVPVRTVCAGPARPLTFDAEAEPMCLVSFRSVSVTTWTASVGGGCRMCELVGEVEVRSSSLTGSVAVRTISAHRPPQSRIAARSR